MAKKKISIDMLYGASPTKKNPNMMRLALGTGEFLDIAKPVYDKAMAGLIESIEYDDATEPLVITDDKGDSVSLKFHRVCGITESGLAKIKRAHELIEAAEGVDTVKLEAAVAKVASIGAVAF